MLLTEREKTSFMSRPHTAQAESTRGAEKRKAVQEEICQDLAQHERLEQEAVRRAPRKALPRRLRRCW